MHITFGRVYTILRVTKYCISAKGPTGAYTVFGVTDIRSVDTGRLTIYVYYASLLTIR